MGRSAFDSLLSPSVFCLMIDPLPNDRPMTEAEWERFMQESDARSAKFGELLETLMDHPDRDAIIDQEMGWDEFEDDPEFNEELSELEANVELQKEFDKLDAEDEDKDEESEDEDQDSDEWDEESNRDQELERELPVYGKAYDWGLAVYRALQPFFPQLEQDHDVDLDEALDGSLHVAAKIVGGHGMGTEDHALCGNIVNCRRGLEGASKSMRALESLGSSGHVPLATIQPLLEQGRQVIEMLETHIAELRSRVWWD